MMVDRYELQIDGTTPSVWRDGRPTLIKLRSVVEDVARQLGRSGQVSGRIIDHKIGGLLCEISVEVSLCE